MPAPSPTWDLVRVYGTWRNQDGTLKAGTYKVVIPSRVTEHTDDDIIPAGTFATGSLQVNSTPSLDILVPATDDPDVDQSDLSVQITITFTDGATTEQYSITVPYANRPTVSGGNGIGVNLRTVALAASLPQTSALYKVGVPGGLAKLNSDGKVVDADGNLVAGSVSTVNGQTGDVTVATGSPIVPEVSGVYPPRPKSTQPVIFEGPDRPAAGGSVLGGAGAVTNLDIWFKTAT